MTIFFRLIYFTCVCYGSQTNTPSFILYSDIYCLPLRELAQVYGELDFAAQLWPGALEVGRGSVLQLLFRGVGLFTLERKDTNIS